MFQTRKLPRKDLPNASELLEARFKYFQEQLKEYETRLEFERTLDGFLDLYSSWKHSKDPQIKLRLVMLIFELHRLNPDFQCELIFSEEDKRLLSSTKT